MLIGEKWVGRSLGCSPRLFQREAMMLIPEVRERRWLGLPGSDDSILSWPCHIPAPLLIILTTFWKFYSHQSWHHVCTWQVPSIS